MSKKGKKSKKQTGDGAHMGTDAPVGYAEQYETRHTKNKQHHARIPNDYNRKHSAARRKAQHERRHADCSEISPDVVRSSINDLSSMCGFSRLDASMFREAYNEALKSDMGQFRTGCVIAYKGRVIGRGCNCSRSHPMQKRYNLMYRHYVPMVNAHANEHTLHAEMAALTSVDASCAMNVSWKDVKVYTYRIAVGLPRFQGPASPCPACAHALYDAGIRNVYYSTEWGFAHGVLDDAMMSLDKAAVRSNLIRNDAVGM